MLVARRELFRNRVPSMPGGGTVAYVNPTEHRYLADIEHREEGGTPAIVESIRAGLVFQLKEARRRRRHPRSAKRPSSGAPSRAGSRTRTSRSSATRTLAALDRLVRRPPRRAGTCTTTSWSRCSTTSSASRRAAAARAPGPTATGCSGIDLDTSHEFEREIARGCEGIKPGWVRVNFNYFISEAVFEYILDAVDSVARDGWRLLPRYRFEPESGLWRHRDGLAEPPLSLGDVKYQSGGMRYASHRHRAPESRLADHLAEARAILAEQPEAVDGPDAAVSADFEALRWFWMPSEVAAMERAPRSVPAG